MGKISLDTEASELFGSLDATDEKDTIFESYFLETKLYRKLLGNKNMYIVVGEKGTGKSALLKMCMITNKKNDEIVIKIQRPLQQSTGTPSQIIMDWKDRIAKCIYEKLTGMGIGIKNEKIIKLIEATEEEVNSFTKNKFSVDYYKIKNAVLDAFSNTCKINVYIDDLDIGYQNTEVQKREIAYLIYAVREMARENDALKFRIALRTDVYYNVRTIDESSDKFQDSIVELKITNHQILAMLTKRICHYLQKNETLDYIKLSQDNMMDLIKEVINPTFYGIGKWKNAKMRHILMSLTRRRPRDLIYLCKEAWNSAIDHQRTCIETEDINNVVNKYSQEKINDVISEYSYDFIRKDDLRETIFALRPSENERKNKYNYKNKDCLLYVYSRDELFKKLDTIIKGARMRSLDSMDKSRKMDALTLARLLFRANVIVGRRDKDNQIVRIYYMENPDLINKFSDSGCFFEVHPAYRWAIDARRQDENIFTTIDIEHDD